MHYSLTEYMNYCGSFSDRSTAGLLHVSACDSHQRNVAQLLLTFSKHL